MSQWTNLGRLVRLDFSASDDLTLIDIAWRALRSLQTLLLNDIRYVRVEDNRVFRVSRSCQGFLSCVSPPGCPCCQVQACMHGWVSDVLPTQGAHGWRWL